MSNDKPHASKSDSPPDSASTTEELLAVRRQKLERLRDEFGKDPYGHRVDGLTPLANAKAKHDPDADQRFKDDPDAGDDRPTVTVAGRVMQHRVMGNLVFMSLRDASGDLQIAVSKKAVGPEAFKIASKLTDLADLVVAQGPLATTKTGEVTVWAATPTEPPADARLTAGYALLTKSLALPPNKFQGLQDPEQRYRKRYVDLYANPEVMRTMLTRSRLLQGVRQFWQDERFLEVETPMMQPLAGGAAARPFVTHHNALDLELYLRIAPELYLKRLLVGGMPRVFEINRNFRNEGIDRSHNPEFTMLEAYEAYGDLYSIMDRTQRCIQNAAGQVNGGGDDLSLPYGDLTIDYGNFRRAGYHELFVEHNGFDASDHEALVAKAQRLKIPLEADGVNKAHDVLLNDVWEQTVEAHLIQPTFVIDYPASLCPLTKRKPTEPEKAERFELFIAGMELANAYTELNDPDVQEANFKSQVDGLDDEESTFRNVDEDFLEALRVGMPPAGGLGIGIDRLVMLMTNQRSIRDVILFPLMRPEQ